MGLKRGLKHLFASQGYDNLQRRVGFSLIILILALILFSGYFLFYYVKPVATSQEFVNAMSSCKSASWIKEDFQASWLYTIKSRTGGDACEVSVRLLKLKAGTTEADKLQGKEMVCVVQKGETQFPEKDISRCSGLLKEELQDIIIQRMHNYLLQNVGEIEQEFEEF